MWILWLLACAGSPDTDATLECAELGCESYVALVPARSDGASLAGFDGAAFLPSGTLAFACAGGVGSGDRYTCVDDGVVLYTAEPSFELEVADADEQLIRFMGELSPEYTVLRGNGPDCPPQCYQATEAITLSLEE